MSRLWPWVVRSSKKHIESNLYFAASIEVPNKDNSGVMLLRSSHFDSPIIPYEDKDTSRAALGSQVSHCPSANIEIRG